MNIAKLENRLDKAISLFESQKKYLDDHPEDFSRSLTVTSLENHIADLRAQLVLSKSARKKEVLEFRFKGSTADAGSIPLDFLGNIAHHLSGAILSAAQKIKEGPKKLTGRIPQEIHKTLNLRLSGIAYGSTKVFITGDLSPDLFGNSLLEETLDNTFSIFNSSSPEQLVDSVSMMGVRGAININRLLKSLASSGYDVEVRWDAPSDKSFRWEADQDKLLQLSNSLAKIKIKDPVLIQVHGKLSMASSRGQFELEDPKGKVYKGTYPPKVYEQIHGLHIGDECEAQIEKSIAINQITDQEKVYFTLINISSFERPRAQ